MKKTLCMLIGAVSLLTAAFAAPAQAAPTILETEGTPIPPGCRNFVYAIVDEPAKRLTVDHPLQLAIGIGVGATGSPCGLTNLFLNADLYYVPVSGPRTLIALASAHGACDQCSVVKAFGGATVPPGTYQVIGTVRQGSLTNPPLSTIQGRTFFYDGFSITAQ